MPRDEDEEEKAAYIAQGAGPAPTDTQKFLARELRVALSEVQADIRTELRQEMNGLKTVLSAPMERVATSSEATRRQVVHLTKMVAVIWNEVKGDEPPPTPPGPNDDTSFMEAATVKPLPDAKPVKPIADLAEQVSEHDNDIAGVTGRLIVVETQTSELLRLQKEQMGKKDPDDQRTILTRAFDGLTWIIREREGQKFALQIIAGLTGLLTAAGTFYALLTGRLPMPNAPPPTPALIEHRD